MANPTMIRFVNSLGVDGIMCVKALFSRYFLRIAIQASFRHVGAKSTRPSPWAGKVKA